MTTKWGPTYWNYIHMITLHYPTNPTKKVRDNNFYLVKNFMNTLPCPACKNEIKKLVLDKNLQISLESRDQFVRYFWNIHNKVNAKLNKAQITFSHFNKLYSSNASFNVFKLIILIK